MSLLDTFTILFQADTGSVEDGARRSGDAADDLLDRLRNTDAAASMAGESFKGFVTGALGALTAALGVGQLVSGTIEKAADITALSQTAEALGVAIEDLDAFGRAAAAAGGDAEGARDSLTDMAEKMGEALSDTESGAAKAFQALKIGLKDSTGQAKGAIDGILDLAQAVEGMDKAEAVFKIKELGITDNRTVEMVLKGRKELERMMAAQKRQGVITQEQADQAKRLSEGMNKLRGALNNAGTGFMTALMPALETGVEWLTKLVEWAGEHSDLIVGFFGAVAAMVIAFYLPAMISAAAATLAATWPIIATVAVLAALAAAFGLVYEDVMSFIKGNNSLIGQIFEKYPRVKEVVFSIIAAFKLMGEIVGGIWKVLIKGFQQVIDFILTGVKQIAQGIRTVASFFGIGSDENPDADQQSPATQDASRPSSSGQSSDGSQSAEQKPARPSGSGQSPEDVPVMPDAADGVASAQTAFAGVQAGRAAMTAANSSPLNATTSNAISNSATSHRETNVQVGEVTINTQATDAQGIASDFGDKLSAQLRQVESESASGVDR